MSNKPNTVAEMNGKTVQNFAQFLQSWKWIVGGMVAYCVAFGAWVVNRDMINREFHSAVAASRFTNADGQILHESLSKSITSLSDAQRDHQSISGHTGMQHRVTAIEGTVTRLESNQQRIMSIQQDTREKVVALGTKIDRLIKADP